VIFSQLESLEKSEQEKLELLRAFIRNQKKACIAYSGGVDSSLVTAIAFEQLGFNAFAVTGVSDSLAPHLLVEARNQALWIGIRHKECKTNELRDPLYNQNPENRCFACKRELHSHLIEITKEFRDIKILDGVNNDDLKEFRPGIKAAQIAGVISPLAELKIGKIAIRSISKSLGLPWWDKPAQPCLASRIPYGESISAQRLQKIAKAEHWFISHGFKEVRVRSQGMTARIELKENKIDKFLMECNRKEIVNYFLSIGFNAVSIDLEGLISGKLNRDINNLH
tara:strand:- start:1745 stop:2590 length:846 start_codon:yes stop_codon:yes gene_type:complete